MHGYDIHGNGLKIGQMRGGIGSFSRLQSAGAFGGLIAGMLVIALRNITGWPIIAWALVPALLGGVVGKQVLGVSLIGHVWHALLFALTRLGWSRSAVVVATEDRVNPPISCALLDGERIVWQVGVPPQTWERQ